jgi:hypothetical protein
MMILGATAFEGVVCNSSADICASDDFAAKIGLTLAPSTSRLKSRRFTLPHSPVKGLLVDGQLALSNAADLLSLSYCRSGTLTYLQDHIYGMMPWYGSDSGGLLLEYVHCRPRLGLAYKQRKSILLV